MNTVGLGNAVRLERIAHISDLSERKPLRVKVNGHNLCVVLSEGQVHVFQNRCPHTGARLDEGRVRRNVITCTHHLAQFDLCTGDLLTAPMEDLNPGSTGPLQLYRVQIEDGWISVDTGEHPMEEG